MSNKIIDMYSRVGSPQDLLVFMDKYVKYGIATKSGNTYAESDEDFTSIWQSDEAIVQSGDQVLNSGHGTCWDQVELERKWFSEHNYDYKTIFTWFEIDGPNDYPTHTFLAYKTADGWNWFENAFEPGIYKYSNLSDLIKYVESRLLNNAIECGVAKESDSSLIKSYEYQKPKLNILIDEYINYVTGK
ncbi:MAG: hypothetical protein ACM3KH_00535 [Thiobacillus sp.]